MYRQIRTGTMWALGLALFATTALHGGENRNRLPWTSSGYLCETSEPALAETPILAMVRAGDRLVLASENRLHIFTLRDEAWTIGKVHELATIRDLVVLGDSVVAVAGAGLAVFDPETGELERTDLLPSGSTWNRYATGAPLPDGALLLFRGDKLHRVDLATRSETTLAAEGLANASTRLVPAGRHVVLVLNGKKIFRVRGETVEDATAELPVSGSGRSLAVSPEGRFLLIGTTSRGLLAIDLETGAHHDYTGKKNPLGLGACWWGATWDTKRDTLYVPGWEAVSAISPASDPASWTRTGVIRSADEVPLYSHRVAAPSAPSSTLYLPQTDELLFAGKLGCTVFAADGNEPFAQPWDAGQYRLDNAALAGEGPFYDRLRTRKLVAVYASSARAPTEADFNSYRMAGANALIYNIFQIDHGRMFPPSDVRADLARLGALCRENGLDLFAHFTPYNISSNNNARLEGLDYRALVTSDGKEGTKLGLPRIPAYERCVYPCYLDEAYSETAGIGYNLAEIAKLAEAGVTGFSVELGDGFSRTNIRVDRDPCLCDVCWNEFLDRLELSAGDEARTLEPAKRLRWIYGRHAWEDYLTMQRERLARLCRHAFDRAEEIAPGLVPMVMLPETTADYDERWFYNAFLEGFESNRKPVLAVSEQTYATPFLPALVNDLENRWRAEGLAVRVVPGVALMWQTPALLERRIPEFLRNTPGVMYYQALTWRGERLDENFYDPENPLDDRTFPLRTYLETLGQVSPPAGE